MTGREWSRESRQDRLRAIAFIALKGDVEEWSLYEKQMDEAKTSLDTWLQMDHDARKSLIEQFNADR